MNLLRDDQLLLVFVVAALGYLVGRIRIGGFGFGVAAVLFVGLAFGMADPLLKVPRSLWTLGLVLFVYTVGLAAGPGFLGALRRQGVGRTSPFSSPWSPQPEPSPQQGSPSGSAPRPQRARTRAASRTRPRSQRHWKR